MRTRTLKQLEQQYAFADCELSFVDWLRHPSRRSCLLTVELSVDVLNAIQAEWMDLQSDASTEEQQRVFALMKRTPTRYLTGGEPFGFMLQLDGLPAWAEPRPLAEALDACRKHGGCTWAAFDGKIGQWYRLKLGTVDGPQGLMCFELGKPIVQPRSIPRPKHWPKYCPGPRSNVGEGT